jgi:hypothetical protein|tara:strand:+ start:618 stop:935 length:318 start_codon:yes stop_codon:yes gene_type:complete
VITNAARAKAMTMLINGHAYVEIERVTGVKNVTARSWNMKRLKGITSLTEVRKSRRHDSGALHDMAEIGHGWDTAMALDLLRYEFKHFHCYFEAKNEKSRSTTHG